MLHINSEPPYIFIANTHIVLFAPPLPQLAHRVAVLLLLLSPVHVTISLLDIGRAIRLIIMSD